MVETRPSLLRRVRDAADQQSWQEFYELYEPLLLNYVRKRGVRGGDADDIVQTIFITLLRHLPTFEYDRSKGRFRTWLWRLSFTALTDWRRKQGRLQRVEDEKRQQTEREKREKKEEEDEWNTDHRRRVMEHALEQVRKQSRPQTWACFEQHLLKKRPGAEVGKELGLSANSVYVNASRVFDRVQELTLELWQELGDE